MARRMPLPLVGERDTGAGKLEFARRPAEDESGAFGILGRQLLGGRVRTQALEVGAFTDLDPPLLHKDQITPRRILGFAFDNERPVAEPCQFLSGLPARVGLLDAVGERALAA